MEKEFQIKQEFNDFLYENYYKRGINLDNYLKNKLYLTFKFNKSREENSFISYLHNVWDKFQDDYF